MAHERELRGNLSLSGLPSSYSFLDVSFSALRLRFSFSRFFFLIFTFCDLLLSYAFQSANLNFSFGGALHTGYDFGNTEIY